MDVKSHIIGIGGVFFKANNASNLQKWYKETLGFSSQLPYDETDTAITFRWKTSDGENHNTVWAPFPKDTKYFEPSKSSWMINYVVRDIEGLIEKLQNDGIQVVDEIQSYSYGKFGWALDPENNKIEFWEPDKEFFADKYD
ncbi:MAG: VOC family protein [Candidatus Heimdallarchaeota archaeon]|nr:VOC family protein [Candidatus Heimdallarchaeota archaeon]